MSVSHGFAMPILKNGPTPANSHPQENTPEANASGVLIRYRLRLPAFMRSDVVMEEFETPGVRAVVAHAQHLAPEERR